ncbi:MAG: ABC transporter substrate-binding protein [Candidatus Onthomonas sp.]
MKKMLALLLALLMALSLAACGAQGTSVETGTDTKTDSAADASTVNIGCTSALGTLNPLMMDGTWINVTAMSLEFLPLVSLNDDFGFDYMLADSITTEDNLTYTVHLRDEATWSDGQPITAEDLAYTMTRIASPLVMNYAMQFTAVVGTDDATGWTEEGDDNLDGLEVVDEKTLNITFKYEINRTSFLNGYAQYILTLPKHVLETIPESELASSSWFDAPDVVSGPYRVTSYDPDHYISYTANENFWMGAPKIQNCNIRIVDGSQLLSGLQSGEIDIVPPLLGTIPEEDYATVQNLEGITASFGSAIATETIFINAESIPDQRVRQAMLCALDRETIVTGLLSGGADLMDGFCVPDGPYASGLEPVSYDPERAKELLAEAGWDGSETYTLYINSGDKTLINACTLCQSYWDAVGIQVKLVTVDLDTLMAQAGDEGTDLLAVQYTYPAVDPSWDIDWLLASWCHLYPDEAAQALNIIWASNEESVLKENYARIDQIAQEQVPLICLYANGPMGAVRSDLDGALPTMYGTINNIHDWDWSSGE